MTKASDNLFPSMLYAEQGSTPSSPSAGNQRLFVRSSDHILCMVNSSGTVTALSGSLTNPMTTAGDIIKGGASGVPARLAIGTAAQGLVSDGSAPVWTDTLPWHISIIPMISTPDATPQGTWSFAGASTDSGLVFPFYAPGSTANSGGAPNLSNFNAGGAAQNDAISYDVVLAKGTWNCHLWVRKSTNTGIVTLQQDGSDMGTVDTYAAAAAAAKVSITSWSVSATGKKRMNFKMATKNASSSNYVLGVFAIEFQRTA